MDVVLASQSPRRRELLGQMGLDFRIIIPDIDEHMDRSLPPDKLVEAISAEKAAAVAAQVGPETVVIAADTVVVWNGAILGKPVHEADARRMLGELAGRLEADSRRQGRVYQVLGLSGGAFLVILLL